MSRVRCLAEPMDGSIVLPVRAQLVAHQLPLVLSRRVERPLHGGLVRASGAAQTHFAVERSIGEKNLQRVVHHEEAAHGVLPLAAKCRLQAAGPGR
jgi:hypothetical protein